jgi:hypothetical protein
MSKCIWILEETTGDHILMINGEEKGRIRSGEEIKMDEGKPASSISTLDELKEQLEKEFQC